MPAVKKLDLSRFKKSMQGLIEFATLIEQASPARREKILRQSALVDSGFVSKALRKVVFYEELEYLEETILAEILCNTSPTTLAYSLRGMPESFRKHLFRHLGYRELRATMDEEEKMLKRVSEEFILGARKQILKIARALEKKNKFVFELADCPRFKLKPKKP